MNMYQLLVRLMVGAALLELGMSWADLRDCRGRECLMRIEKASREITRIKWRPIVVFPEEAKRLR
jgi:hypothetical protein